jgi:beta-ketoacyl synthase-like protein
VRAVAIRAWGVWTGGGVGLNTAPPALVPGALGPWADAPKLSAFHRRLRRPHPSAAALTQLGHAVLGGQHPPLERTGLVLGTSAGSAAADFEFLQGLRERGAAFGSPASFVYTLPSSAPSELSIGLGLTGGLWTVAAGSATGLTALALAAGEVSSGRLEACLCGQFELAAHAGRQTLSSVPADYACLFLVAARSETAGERVLGATLCGFGAQPDPVGGEGPPALLEVARLCAMGGAPRDPVVAEDSRGYWARVAFT